MRNRNSQSALEYMMSYGWAILIIVIVAAALWSFGVFNPSSSVSTTVTGFSGLGSVTAQCIGNQGLSIQLGNSLGFTIQIQNISVSSATSNKVATIYPQQTMASEGSAVFYIPNVCPPTSSKYSLSVTVFYTETSQPFPGPYPSTGTVSGTTSGQQLSLSSTITTAIPLTITNNQNTSTANPFQQMLAVPSQVYGGYAASNFQNVEFFYANGTIIPSWLENYSPLNATYWLKLQAIPSLSSVQIYMGFASTSTNLFNTLNDGEAPQISGTYGQYDDGANIFTQYGGASWGSFTFIQGTWVTSNGYLQQTSTLGNSNSAALIESKNYSATASYILGMAFSYTTQANARVGIAAIMSAGPCGYRFVGQQANSGAGFISFLNDNVVWIANNGYQGALSTNYAMVITDAGGTWSGSLYNGYTENGGALTSLSQVAYTANNCASKNAGYVGISAAYWTGSSTSANPLNVQWFYMRAYPPNGVMPSVSFGQSSSIKLPANVQTYIPITVSNNQNTSISNFQQMITSPSSVYSAYANLSGTHSFQNVEFFYANGTIIPSWLENYTASNARWWVRLPSVLAYTSFTIYMGFVPKTTNLFNKINTGEGPTLSSTYGQYDDGAKIFLKYWNFSGTSLPPNTTSANWTAVRSCSTINNGVVLCAPGGANQGGLLVQISTITATTGIAIDSYITPVSVSQGYAYIMDLAGSSTAQGGNNCLTYGYSFAFSINNTGLSPSIGGVSTGGTCFNLNVTHNLRENIPVVETILLKSGLRIEEVGYSYPLYAQDTTQNTFGFLMLATGSIDGQNINTYNLYWARFRTYPPNGVIPSVTFGSVQ